MKFFIVVKFAATWASIRQDPLLNLQVGVQNGIFYDKHFVNLLSISIFKLLTKKKKKKKTQGAANFQTFSLVYTFHNYEKQHLVLVLYK